MFLAVIYIITNVLILSSEGATQYFLSEQDFLGWMCQIGNKILLQTNNCLNLECIFWAILKKVFWYSTSTDRKFKSVNVTKIFLKYFISYKIFAFSSFFIHYQHVVPIAEHLLNLHRPTHFLFPFLTRFLVWIISARPIIRYKQITV